MSLLCSLQEIHPFAFSLFSYHLFTCELCVPMSAPSFQIIPPMYTIPFHPYSLIIQKSGSHGWALDWWIKRKKVILWHSCFSRSLELRYLLHGPRIVVISPVVKLFESCFQHHHHHNHHKNFFMHQQKNQDDGFLYSKDTCKILQKTECKTVTKPILFVTHVLL